jgi:ubiquinone biosynthesis protein COQ4
MTPIATPEIPPPPANFAKRRWRRAFRALRELIGDPDDTAKALDVSFAIGTRDFERGFQRFARSTAGRALLAERPSLAAALSDRAALERLRPDSFGRAYLEYLDASGFRATGLLELQNETQARWERDDDLPRIDPIRAWYRDRVTLAHDLFHVVTGYGTDELGEATLLAFSQAQLGGVGNALLTAGAAFEVFRRLGFRWIRYELRAWRRGLRAPSLVALPWEEMLPLRLTTVRRLARVDEPEDAHPGGILRGRRSAEGAFQLS